LFLEDAALERAAGADHAHGVEPLRPRQRATRPVLDGPQEARRAVDVLHYLAELVEQLQSPAGGDLCPAPERLHCELQAGARCPARWRCSTVAAWRRRPSWWRDG